MGQEKIKGSKERLKAVSGDFVEGTADGCTYVYMLALKRLLLFHRANEFFLAACGKKLCGPLPPGDGVRTLTNVMDYSRTNATLEKTIHSTEADNDGRDTTG